MQIVNVLVSKCCGRAVFQRSEGVLSVNTKTGKSQVGCGHRTWYVCSQCGQRCEVEKQTRAIPSPPDDTRSETQKRGKR